MKKLLTAAATAVMIAGLSAPAMAAHCPKDMKAIDAALAKNPKLSADQMSKVKSLRAKGEELHKAGKHKESVESLGQAMGILGIK